MERTDTVKAKYLFVLLEKNLDISNEPLKKRPCVIPKSMNISEKLRLKLI